MQAKLLPPCMQQSYHAQLHTGITAKLIDRLPGCFEQCIVHQLWPVQRKGVQLMGQRENDMIVSAGQQFMRALLNPLLTPVPLAFGTMPVATAVVADAGNTTLVTHVHMATECRCTAYFDGAEGAQLMGV